MDKPGHWLHGLCGLLALLLLSGCMVEMAEIQATVLPTATITALSPTESPLPIPTITTQPLPAATAIIQAKLPPATLPPLQPTTIAEAGPPTVTPTPRPQPDFPIQTDAPFLPYPPATVACDGGGLLFRSRFPSRYGGLWRDYHVYLPPCYGVDGHTYPVIYLFHGSIQTASQWADLGLVWHLDNGIADGRYPPVIVIMPENGAWGNFRSGGPQSIEGITVNSLIPYIDQVYCTWPERAGRSIGGISRGGYWALMIAFLHPELFTAVAGHSSHLRLATDSAEFNPLVTYAQADLSQLDIWLDWGEMDFLRPGQKELDASLTAAGVAHQATVNPGGHNEPYWVENLGSYLDWHLAHWLLDRSSYPLCP